MIVDHDITPVFVGTGHAERDGRAGLAQVDANSGQDADAALKTEAHLSALPFSLYGPRFADERPDHFHQIRRFGLSLWE